MLAGAATADATVPPNFSDTMLTQVVGPRALAFTPDGRLLIAQQSGSLRVHQNGSLVTTPALTFTADGVDADICTNFERGLLGVAVDPTFASNRRIYLFYTHKKSDATCVNRVSRFELPDGNVIDRTSELVLVDNMPSTNGNNNGGPLGFGRDGLLYATIGDGGCDYFGDSGCAGINDAARDEHTLVGKILRIAPDGGIPAGNPFQGAGTARCNATGGTTAGDKCQETFAWGLHDPRALAFDPNDAGTRLFVNDSGQAVREEIDLGQAGADYGWNCREGTRTNSSTGPCSPTPPALVAPVFEWTNGVQVPGTTSPTNCGMISAGAFVPNGIWPSAYDGAYLAGDYFCGWIFAIAGGATLSASDFATNLGGGSVRAMAFQPSGSSPALYYATDNSGGEVRRVSYAIAGNSAPVANGTASPSAGLAPLTVSFSSAGTSDPDSGDTLTYFWDFGDGTTETSTASTGTTHAYSAPGQYTATLRARDDKFAFSPPVSFTVTARSAPAPVGFSDPAYQVNETAGSATITISRPSGGAAGSVRVVTASGGPAAPGADFTSHDETVSFLAGETTKTVTVAVLDDQTDEPAETVSLELKDPTGDAALGSPATATLTIVDDDPTPDADGDGVLDAADNCPATANPSQENADGDTEGDACDADDDSDGSPDAADCNDTNAAVRPGATDTPGNGVDEDCSGADAEHPPAPDADGDGSPDLEDCDDGNSAIRPGATDVPANLVDENCDGFDAAFVGSQPTAGSDYLTGTAAGDTICGLLGNDVIFGGGGNDTLFGDACNGKVRLVAIASAGSDGDDRLNGQAGDDSLYGAGGRDTLRGGKGKDRLYGGDGDDTLLGEAGNDSLAGGRGPDKLAGGPGVNRYRSGAGDDTVNARNRRQERIDCGAGRKDSATVDRADSVRGCEKVRRR